MTDPFDPDLLTPAERAREVAEILAEGYLRHRALRVAEDRPDDGGNPPHSPRQPENELDASGDQSVHATRADGTPPPAKKEART